MKGNNIRLGGLLQHSPPDVGTEEENAMASPTSSPHAGDGRLAKSTVYFSQLEREGKCRTCVSVTLCMVADRENALQPLKLVYYNPRKQVGKRQNLDFSKTYTPMCRGLPKYGHM